MKKTMIILAAMLMLTGIIAPTLNAAIVNKPVVVTGDDPLPLPPPPRP